MGEGQSAAPEAGRALRPALSAAHQDRGRRKEREDMAKTIREAWIEVGAVIGEARYQARAAARGEAPGEFRVPRLTVLKRLEAKFGTLPPGVEAGVGALTLAELDALEVALTRAELRAWGWGERG